MTSMLIITIITLLYAQLAVGDSPSPIIGDLQTYPHGNPFMPSVYGFIDAAYYDPKYWVYSSGAPPGQNSTKIFAYSSGDLKTWDGPGQVALDITSFNWTTGPILAAATVRKATDRYFLYFLTFKTGGSGNLSISVGFANHPEGPYADGRGGPELLDTGSPMVDYTTGALAAFTDTDSGKTYLYFYGHKGLKSQRLSDDMKGPDGSQENLNVRNTTSGDFNGFYDNFQEIAGLKMFKRGNSYYLIFKHCNDWVTQAKSDSLTGQFASSEPVLQADGTLATSIGQATVVNNNNSDVWYLVYSRKFEYNNGSAAGVVSGLASDQMTFNDVTDKSINWVSMLVHDDFQDPAHYKDIWVEKTGTVYSQCPPLNPSCRQTGGAGDSASLMPNNFTDLDYSITVVGSQSMGADPSAGVVFCARYAQLKNSSALEGYYAAITFDSKVLLGKIGQTFTFLKSADLPKPNNFMSENKLRVIAKGQNISVRVNDAVLIDIIDATYPWGMTGTRVYNAGAKFSDLWIKPASG